MAAKKETRTVVGLAMGPHGHLYAACSDGSVFIRPFEQKSGVQVLKPWTEVGPVPGTAAAEAAEGSAAEEGMRSLEEERR